ncbi:biotin/lipoyl-containing protein [Aquibium sp. LZ166]|uniref:Biotin/lipoyl-containing protein n=1 Tax=Aquibium pacificus TaxID=3153579 RepID=A0ABV3SSX8_9HYPH
MRRILEVHGEEIPVWLASVGQFHVLHLGDREIPCALTTAPGKGAFTLDLNGTSIALRIAVGEEATFVHLDGRAYEIGRTDPSQTLGQADGGAPQDRMIAPMPGAVISVSVAAGDAVTEGQALMVIESMKLETTITAPRDGVVSEVHFAPGDSFDGKVVLIGFEPLKDAS